MYWTKAFLWKFTGSEEFFFEKNVACPEKYSEFRLTKIVKR